MSLFQIKDIDTILIPLLSTDSLLNLYQVNTYYHDLLHPLFADFRIVNNFSNSHSSRLINSCKFGFLKCVQYFYSKCDYSFDIKKRAFCKACKHGRLEVIKWINDDNYFKDVYSDGLYYACDNNQLAVAQLLYSFDDSIVNGDVNDFMIACENGYLELAKWLFSVYPDFGDDVEEEFTEACLNGHLHMLQWLFTLHPNILEGYCEICFFHACESGFIDIAKWLHSVRVNIHLDDRKKAKINDKEILEWLKKIDL